MTCGNPRKFTSENPNGENFILVGASQSSPSVKFEENNKDDKALRYFVDEFVNGKIIFVISGTTQCIHHTRDHLLNFHIISNHQTPS